MESPEGKIKLWLGAYKVINVALKGEITIDLGKNITITVHPGDVPHTVKEGMHLHLFTEIPYADTRQTPIQ